MKRFVYLFLMSCMFLFNMNSKSYSASLTYSGSITNVIEYEGFQPYATIGDDLNIYVEYDDSSFNPIEIIVNLEYWGDMMPLRSPVYSNYSATNDWIFQTTTTKWQLHNDAFTLESDGFACIITGSVNPVCPTPEVSSILLISTGFIFLLCGNRKRLLS